MALSKLTALAGYLLSIPRWTWLRVPASQVFPINTAADGIGRLALRQETLGVGVLLCLAISEPLHGRPVTREDLATTADMTGTYRRRSH